MQAGEGANKRIAKNTIILYIRMGITMLVSLYTSRVVLSTLGEMNYGILNIVSGSVAIFTFLNGALSGSASRYLTYELGKRNHAKLQRTFSSSLHVHIAVGIIIVILSETVGLWLLDDKLVIPSDRMYAAHWAYQISVATVFLSILQVPYSALIVAHEKMDIYAYLSIGDIVVKLGLIFLLQIIGGDKLIIWTAMMMSVTFLYTSAYITYCKKKFPESKLIFHKEYDIYKNLFSFASWNLIGSISGMAQSQGINLILNIYYGPIINAARAIASQVQGSMMQFSGNFMMATKPQIIKRYAAEDYKGMMELVYFSSSLSFYLVWLFTLPVILELPFILRLWLGKYPEYTVSFTFLTLILALVLSIKDSRTTATLATGKIKTTNLTVCVVLLLTFPIAWILLKLGFSPNSVIIETIILTIIGEVIAIRILRRYISFSIKRYFTTVYGRCLLVGIVSSILPTIIHHNMPPGIIRFITVTLVSISCSIMTIYFIGLSNENRILLKRHTQSILSKFRNK